MTQSYLAGQGTLTTAETFVLCVPLLAIAMQRKIPLPITGFWPKSESLRQVQVVKRNLILA